jgi:hypothetical protein
MFPIARSFQRTMSIFSFVRMYLVFEEFLVVALLAFQKTSNPKRDSKQHNVKYNCTNRS